MGLLASVDLLIASASPAQELASARTLGSASGTAEAPQERIVGRQPQAHGHSGQCGEANMSRSGVGISPRCPPAVPVRARYETTGESEWDLVPPQPVAVVLRADD